MKSASDSLLGTAAQAATTDSIERLGALTRILSYARMEANELEADVVAYCLDVALAAVIDSLRQQTAISTGTGNGQDGGSLRHH
jgi:hypothetical protein